MCLVRSRALGRRKCACAHACSRCAGRRPALAPSQAGTSQPNLHDRLDVGKSGYVGIAAAAQTCTISLCAQVNINSRIPLTWVPVSTPRIASPFQGHADGGGVSGPARAPNWSGLGLAEPPGSDGRAAELRAGRQDCPATSVSRRSNRLTASKGSSCKVLWCTGSHEFGKRLGCTGLTTFQIASTSCVCSAPAAPRRVLCGKAFGRPRAAPNDRRQAEQRGAYTSHNLGFSSC